MNACDKSATENRPIAEIDNDDTEDDGSSWIDQDEAGSNWDDKEYVEEGLDSDEDDMYEFWNWSEDEEDKDYEEGASDGDNFQLPDHHGCNRGSCRAECSYQTDSDDN
jgi:hypothetical protein